MFCTIEVCARLDDAMHVVHLGNGWLLPITLLIQILYSVCFAKELLLLKVKEIPIWVCKRMIERGRISFGKTKQTNGFNWLMNLVEVSWRRVASISRTSRTGMTPCFPNGLGAT